MNNFNHSANNVFAKLFLIVTLLLTPTQKSFPQVSAEGMIVQKILQDMIEVLLQTHFIETASQFELDKKINESYSKAKARIDRHYENKIENLKEGFRKRQNKRLKKSNRRGKSADELNEENMADFKSHFDEKLKVENAWKDAIKQLDAQKAEIQRACWEIRKDNKVTNY